MKNYNISLQSGIINYFIIILIINLSFNSQYLMADTIVIQSLESITKQSDKIIIGNIIEIGKSDTYSKMSLAKVKVQICETIKGKISDNYIWVEGCRIKKVNNIFDAYGLAKFQINESVILFLVETKGSYEVLGAFQGKYTIKNDSILFANSKLKDFKSAIIKFLNNEINSLTITSEYYRSQRSLQKITTNSCGTDLSTGFYWNNADAGCPVPTGHNRWSDVNGPKPRIYINPSGARYKIGNNITNLTFSQVKGAIECAFSAWSSTPNTYVDYEIDPVSSNYTEGCDNLCTVSWSNTPTSTSTIFYLTKSADGYTTSCDIIFRSDLFWNADDPDFTSNCFATNPYTYDICSYASHEIGHFWGLGQTATQVSSIMNTNWPYCRKKYLGDADYQGIEFLNRRAYGYIYGDFIWCSSTTPGDPPPQIHVVGNVTIPTGSTFTIQPGAIVKFYNGSSINVYGTLNANGTSSNRIIFQSGDGSSWGGIKIYSNNVSMSYCKIQNASTGIYVESATPSIQWTWINNCGNAICFNGGSASLTNNTIAYNTSQGITAYNNASVSMCYNARNIITQSNTGLYAVNGGYIYASQGNNSSYNNRIYGSYEASTGNGSNIIADGNYWSQCPPPSSWFYGNVTYTNSVCPDPNSGRSLQKHNTIMDYNPQVVMNNKLDELGEIYKSWQEKDYTSVKTKSKSLISLNVGKDVKNQSLIMYRAACQMTNDNEIEQYL